MTPTSPVAQRGAATFPMRAFGLAIALTVGLLALAAADGWRLNSGIQTLAARDLRLTTLAGTIVHLDEALTMSARMAAATGDPQWEARYRQLEPDLDRAIAEAKRLAPDAALHAGAAATDTANVELVKLEQRAFALVRAGERSRAATLLTSAEYAELKLVYTAGMVEANRAMRTRVSARIDEFRRHARRSAAFGAVMFVLITLSWWRIARLVKSHLAARHAAEAALLAVQETLEERVEARTAEIERAHEALKDAHTSLERNQASLVLSEKMASLGRLTAGIAHEMNSPLGAVRASLQTARELSVEYGTSLGDADVTVDDHRSIARELLENLSTACAGTDRAMAFVRSIKAQTRQSPAGALDRFDVMRAIRDALSLLGHAASAAGCSVQVESTADGVLLDGAPGRIEQVVTNLVRNALDASAEVGGGSVRVVVAREDDELTITVVDDGPGMAPDVVGRIFDPLFTTKPTGTGTGLGLTIVHDIVRGEFGGRIEVRSSPGAGSTFVVRLPLPKGTRQWPESTKAA